MIINFRQGIVKKQQSPNFLNISGNYINLDASYGTTVASFSHGKRDYLIAEVESVPKAWKIGASESAWLYWEIDQRTGERVFGKTNIEPTFGNVFPDNPPDDLHFFNLSDFFMYVWNGFRWEIKIRVFAGKVQSGSILKEYDEGSQVRLSQIRKAGFVLFDKDLRPIKSIDREGISYFLTTESRVNSSKNENLSYSIEFNEVRSTSFEPIPEGHAVTWYNNSRIKLATPQDFLSPAIGICAKDSPKGTLGKFITDGFMDSFSFNFKESEFGKPLWVGETGKLTTTPPTEFSQQRVGKVIDERTIFVDIEELVIIDQDVEVSSVPVSPSPTPSTTASVTPTVTPSVTASVTPTVTPSVTASVTPTATPSVTPSTSVAGSCPSLESISYDFLGFTNTVQLNDPRNPFGTFIDLSSPDLTITVNIADDTPGTILTVTPMTDIVEVDQATRTITFNGNTICGREYTLELIPFETGSCPVVSESIIINVDCF